MALELTGFNYFLPLFIFLLVFFVMYSLLSKLKIIDGNKFVHVLVSFIIAIIFVTFTSTREIILKTTPWFAVLIIFAFFVMMLVGFTQKKMDDIIGPWLGWILIILIALIFLILVMKVMGYSFLEGFGDLSDLYTDYPKIFGAVSVLIVAALASWVMTRK